MAIYEYRCERDGAFDLVAPMGTAPATASCPECAGESARVFSDPMLGTFAPRELVAALDRQERTRHEPEVGQRLRSRADGADDAAAGEASDDA